MEFSSPLQVFAAIGANRAEPTTQERSSETTTKGIEFSTPKKGLIQPRYSSPAQVNPTQRMVVLPVPAEILDQLYADVLPFYEINIRLVPDSDETPVRDRMLVPTELKKGSLPTVAASSPSTSISAASQPSMSFTVPASQLVAEGGRPEAGGGKIALQPKAPIVESDAPVRREKPVSHESAVQTVPREPLQPRTNVSVEPVATDLSPSPGPAPLPTKIVLTPRQSEPSTPPTPTPTPIPTKIASRSKATVDSETIDANKVYSQVEFRDEPRPETKPLASTTPEKDSQVRPAPIVFAPTPIPIKIASPSQSPQKQPSLQGKEISAPESASARNVQKDDVPAEIAALFVVPKKADVISSMPVVKPVSAEVAVRPAIPVPTMRPTRIIEPEPLEPERLALDPSDLFQDQQEEAQSRKRSSSHSATNDKQGGKPSEYFAPVTGLFKKFDNAKGDRWSSKSQTAEKTETPNPYVLGLEAERRQDYVTAVKMYKKFIKDNRIDAGREKEVESNSMLAAPYHRLAMISWRLQEVDHADFYFQQASGFAAGRNQFIVADDYAQFLASQGDYKRAEVVVRNLLIVSPKNTDFHAKLGQCLAMQDRPVESLRHYKVAYSEDRAYYEVAKVYYDKNDFAMARVMDERRQRYIAENRISNPYRPDFGPMNLPQYAAHSAGEMSPYYPPPVVSQYEPAQNREYRPVTFVGPPSP